VLLLKRGELVRLHDIHIEEDAGRTIAEEGCKLVDFNRAGTPLVEIVTEATEVEIEKLESFVVDLGESLREVVLAFSVSRCRMELGEFRADVNFSLMAGERKTERVEIKNLNSFRFMLKAVQCELQKHIALLEKNEVNRSGTFLYDVKSNQTVFTRLKEATSDYCYMPDPDIPSFPITTSLLESSKKQYDEKNEIFASLRTCFTEKELLDMYDKRIELFLYKSPVKDLRKSYLWLNRFLKLDDRSEREQIKLAYNFLSATERHKLSTSDSKLLFETLRKEKTIEIELLIEQLLERKTEATIDLKELVEYYIQRESELTEKIRSGKTNAVNRLLGIILSENRVDAKGLREFLLSYFDIRA
jgi:aspartyl-tRNA(Asn)/glutamyl-tRNA(Gln) amidotransferase subunit B